MIDSTGIRKSLTDDNAAIETLYPNAFPDEDLLPLVRELMAEEQGVLSLVGIAGGAVSGHVMFTACSLNGGADKVALLGPLAVDPCPAAARHRQRACPRGPATVAGGRDAVRMRSRRPGVLRAVRL